MRLPLKDSDYFVTKVNETVKTIDEEFFDFLKPKLQMKKVDVMLGDGTITTAETFDPIEITNEFRRILQSLKDWTFTDISESSLCSRSTSLPRIASDLDCASINSASASFSLFRSIFFCFLIPSLLSTRVEMPFSRCCLL